MSTFGRHGGQPEGRRGSRIDSEDGGCYLDIPQDPPIDRPAVTIIPVSTESGAVQILLNRAGPSLVIAIRSWSFSGMK